MDQLPLYANEILPRFFRTENPNGATSYNLGNPCMACRPVPPCRDRRTGLVGPVQEDPTLEGTLESADYCGRPKYLDSTPGCMLPRYTVRYPEGNSRIV
jgi:hypothetical protein